MCLTFERYFFKVCIFALFRLSNRERVLWGALVDVLSFGQILTQIASSSALRHERNRTISVRTNAGREIAPNTGANAPKFFTLVTKS